MSAFTGCWEPIEPTCQDNFTIRVLFDQPVIGQFTPGDFMVDENIVSAVDPPDCQSCERLTLRISTPIADDDTPAVNYTFVETPGRERPRAVSGLALQDQIVGASDGINLPLPAVTAISQQSLTDTGAQTEEMAPVQGTSLETNDSSPAIAADPVEQGGRLILAQDTNGNGSYDPAFDSRLAECPGTPPETVCQLPTLLQGTTSMMMTQVDADGNIGYSDQEWPGTNAVWLDVSVISAAPVILSFSSEAGSSIATVTFDQPLDRGRNDGPDWIVRGPTDDGTTQEFEVLSVSGQGSSRTLELAPGLGGYDGTISSVEYSFSGPASQRLRSKSGNYLLDSATSLEGEPTGSADPPRDCVDPRYCIPVVPRCVEEVCTGHGELLRACQMVNEGDAFLPSLTPSGRIMAVSVNAKLAFCNPSCQVKDRGEDEPDFVEQPSPKRRKALAHRLLRLMCREMYGGPFDDHMGYVPDIILLQEAWIDEKGDNDAAVFAHVLESVTGLEWGIAVQSQKDVDTLCPSGYDPLSEGRKGVCKRFRGETAVVFNKATLDKFVIDGDWTKSTITSKWEPFDGGSRLICSSEERTRAEVPLDIDGDGVTDCKFAEQRRHLLVGLVERDDGDGVDDELIMGAISAHLIHDNDFSNAARADGSAEEYHRLWSQEIAAKMELRIPGADLYVVGGDFNQSRCIKGEQPAGTFGPGVREPVNCPNPRSFWPELAGTGFVDTVYDVYSGSDNELSGQYQDGYEDADRTDPTPDPHFRGRRIDYLFAKLSLGTVIASSHDLSCGYVPAPTQGQPPLSFNCDEEAANAGGTLTNPISPYRYSDHRLLWSLLGN